MDISDGFQIEQPNVFVPWELSETELIKLLGQSDLHQVANGYFVTRCTSLGGLSHRLGFHFDPHVGDRLAELEFFDSSYPYGIASYEAFQRHLEITFGRPTVTSPGTEGFPSHKWRFGGVEVIHIVQEHFGPAEYVRIRRTV